MPKPRAAFEISDKPVENINAEMKNILRVFMVARVMLEQKLERKLAPKEVKKVKEGPKSRPKAPERKEKSPREKIWEGMKTNGINLINLRKFRNNLELFTAGELKIVLAVLNDLKHEWGPAFQPFLQSLIPELEQMQAVKARLEQFSLELKSEG